MKVKIKEEDGKEYDLDDLFKEWEERKNKMNFLWKYLSNKYPRGYAGYNVYYAITHPWVILREWGYQIKWAWQRVFHSYDERVTWSLDWYLSKKIPLWIEDLKRTKHGTPSSVFEGEPDSNGLYTTEQWEKAKEKYDNILDEISIGFQSYIKKEDYGWNSKERKELEERFEYGFDLFKEYFSTLWD